MFLKDSSTLTSALTSSMGYVTWSANALITLNLSNGPTYLGNSPWHLKTFPLKSLDIVTEIQQALTQYFSINEGLVSSSETLVCA